MGIKLILFIRIPFRVSFYHFLITLFFAMPSYPMTLLTPGLSTKLSLIACVTKVQPPLSMPGPMALFLNSIALTTSADTALAS